MTAYFPFTEEAERLIRLTRKGRREHLIRGGRGIGKTTVLEFIGRQTGGDMGRSLFVEGRYGAAATKMLDQASPDTCQFLLIDDIDYLVEQSSGLAAFESFLLRRGGQLDRGRTAVVATMTITQRELIDRVRPDPGSSSLATNAEVTELAPWSTDWQGSLLKSVRNICGVANPGDAWTQSIIAVTGGHPTLVAAALTELSKHIEGQQIRPKELRCDVDDADTLETLLRVRLSSTAFSRLAGVVHQLSEEDKDLLASAARDEANLRSIDPFSAARLLGSGLVYAEPDDLRLHVVNGMIREYLSTERPVHKLELRHSPSGDEQGHSGTVSIVKDQRVIKTVTLTGTNWKLFSIVVDAGGKVVSNEEIERFTALKGSALNSALQRLRSTLRSAGIERVIDNVRNEGYRQADVPLVNELRANREAAAR